jgi:hypothetical protein
VSNSFDYFCYFFRESLITLLAPSLARVHTVAWILAYRILSVLCRSVEILFCFYCPVTWVSLITSYGVEALEYMFIVEGALCKLCGSHIMELSLISIHSVRFARLP